MRPAGPALLLVATLASGCLRAGFAEGDRPLEAGPRDTSADRSPDAPPGDAAWLEAGSDAKADSGAPTITCKAPQLVGSNQPENLSEPALTADSAELWANVQTTQYGAARTTGGAFGSWTELETTVSGYNDPAFFAAGTESYVVMATSVKPRRLEICSGPNLFNCSPLKLQSPSGVIATDTDGPSVRLLTGGQLLMTHNLHPGAGKPRIYLATPTLPDDPAAPWKTSALPVVPGSGPHDDPTLSPDARLVVFSGDGANAAGEDLFFAARASIADSFSTAVPISVLNTTSTEQTACLASSVAADGVIELFFASNRGGSMQIYRSECTLR